MASQDGKTTSQSKDSQERSYPPIDRERLEAIRELLKMFKLERIIYASVSIISFAALITCAVSLLLKDKIAWPELVGIFGSSGFIGLSTARVLRMWSDAIKILFIES